jgi:hypothetical protein
MFPHHNIHKYTWISPEGKTHNQTNYVLVDRRQHSRMLFVQSFGGAYCDTEHYLVGAEVRKSLAVSKRAAWKIDTKRFNI